MSKFNFDKQLERLEAAKSTLPIKIGNQAQRFFLSSFKNEGWDNGGINHWVPRKDQTNTRNLLVGKSGRLRRAVADCVREATWNRIKLVVDLPYASIHNEGGQAGRGLKATIPKRQYMGDSETLRLMQKELIISEINKVLTNGR